MSEKLLEATLLCDEKSVAEGLDCAHMKVASILTYNDENSLGGAIGLAYYSARKDYKLHKKDFVPKSCKMAPKNSYF